MPQEKVASLQFLQCSKIKIKKVERKKKKKIFSEIRFKPLLEPWLMFFSLKSI